MYWMLIAFKVFYCFCRHLGQPFDTAQMSPFGPLFVDWEKWENKTIIVRKFNFNQREKELSHVGGIAKLPVLCCKWHLSNIIIIQNAPLPPVPLRGANRRLHFNQQRLGGEQQAGAGDSVGGMEFERGAACEGPHRSCSHGLSTLRGAGFLQGWSQSSTPRLHWAGNTAMKQRQWSGKGDPRLVFTLLTGWIERD